MTALVPVLPFRKLRAWPKASNPVRVEYVAIGEALTTRYATDAHLTAYSVPAVPHRLMQAALVPKPRPELAASGVPMVAVLFDVDSSKAHQVGGDAADAWWLDELDKVERLRVEHPDGFVYRTRGGYRIVYALAEPVVLREAGDVATWTETYEAWVAYLERRFGILADESCSDWTRLFRVPHATRLPGHGPEERETFGDAHALGVWVCKLAPEDRAAPKRAPKPRRPPPEHLDPSPIGGDGILAHVFRARGVLGRELEPGKWTVACPWEASHTKGTAHDGSTVLFAPRAGSHLGWLHCSHAHCTGRDVRDVLPLFTEDELAAARLAAGLTPTPATEAVPEPVDVVLTANEHAVNDEVLGALGRLPDVFHRSDVLVDVVREPTGAPRIRELPLACLRDHLTRVVTFLKVRERGGGSELEPAHPPDWCVRAIHARGVWPGLRELVGVTETPVLRPDGTVLQVPGFDARTGLLYVPMDDFPEVPEAPSQHDAARAARTLCEPFVDFPFASEAHRSAAVAIVLSVLARPAFEGPSPLKVIDASTPASGKSLLAEVCATIATGRPTPKMPHVADDDEARKAITSLALDGSPIALLDNVVHTLGSPALDAALTSTVWKDRVLGRSAVVTLSLRIEWIATGNNVTYQGETARRTLPVRLEPAHENPELRGGFVHRDLRGFVLEARPRLVAAALTILRGYVAAGMPRASTTPWGSFEGWSALIPPALVWAGLADPMETRRGMAESDTRKHTIEGLVEGWDRIAGPGGALTASQAIQMMYPAFGAPSSKTTAPHVEQLRQVIETAIPSPGGRTPDARRLGKLLQAHRGQVCGGRKLDSTLLHGTQHWRVVRVASSPAAANTNAVA